MPRKNRPKSRATRWGEAVSAGQDALQAAQAAYQEVQDLLEEKEGLEEPEGDQPEDVEDHQAEVDRLDRETMDQVDALNAALANLATAMEDLGGVREEYESWKDNMGDALEGTPTHQALEALLDEVEDPSSTTVPDSWSLGDDEPDLDELESLLDAADGATLAYGWGKD